MIVDIARFLKNKREFTSAQELIGMKNIFRGIVVKEWVEQDEECINFHECSKVIVKICMKCYHDMQKLRCVEWHKEEKK